MKVYSQWLNRSLLSLLLPLILLCSPAPVLASPIDSTIIDEWQTIMAPPAPEVKPVSIDPKTTALLILDIQSQTAIQRPLGMSTVIKINNLLQKSRNSSMLIVYSLTPTGKYEDIIPLVEPLLGEPIVKSGVDKFYNTELDGILKEKGIKTLIITGTAAHGAVLHTATGAALRNYQVIIPVDGMSAINQYAEQYTAWHMMNSPGTRTKVTLTEMSLITL